MNEIQDMYILNRIYTADTYITYIILIVKISKIWYDADKINKNLQSNVKGVRPRIC